MELERPAELRTDAAEEEGRPKASPLRSAFSVNGLAELVADVVEHTGLLSADDIASVRARARTGSFPQALIDEGAAALGGRFGLPVVDLLETGVAAEAVGEIPLHVLERVVAIPFEVKDGSLRVAVADPQNVNAIDELKLATRLPIELAVASRDDILAEVRRIARAAEAFGARALIEAEEEELEAQDEGAS